MVIKEKEKLSRCFAGLTGPQNANQMSIQN
jgi:hypothetical protein